MPQALSVTIPMALLYRHSDRAGSPLSGPRVRRAAGLRRQASSARCGRSRCSPATGVRRRPTCVHDHRRCPTPTRRSARSPSTSSRRRPESDVKPRAFYQGLPEPRRLRARRAAGRRLAGRVPGRHHASRSDLGLLRRHRGHLLINRDQRTAHLRARKRHARIRPSRRGRRSTTSDSFDSLVLNLDAESVFTRTQLLKGDNEMTRRRAEARTSRHAAAERSLQKPAVHHPAEVLDPGAMPGPARQSAWRSAPATARTARWRAFALGVGSDFRLLHPAFIPRARRPTPAGSLRSSPRGWSTSSWAWPALALVIWRAERVRARRCGFPLPRFGRASRSRPPLMRGAPARRRARRPCRARPADPAAGPAAAHPAFDLYIARRYLSVFFLAFLSLIGIFYIADASSTSPISCSAA